jgi:ATP-dependent RNA helicase SUPV3L1/SUV3
MNPKPDGRVLAVLGPTNTGKTHFALERMLGHASGMIGFPLRLLARENYERVVRARGIHAVALVTGEEKIVPAHPRYFICTTEAMPLDRRVAFLAVDEIQLCADPDRGHIFTDRLLHARGEEETLFLGAETIKPLIRRLIPGTEFITRPRFSQLSYTGPRKLTRLPPRSAVVAFSAAEVYAMAEYVRRSRGGAAVVLGALSPRTRNAQVALYQGGEVDYIVATDAIGMGLNMDVDHVAFAALRKFDGRAPRDLMAAEIAQIAGRAGRHMNDGTFGTTGDSGAIAPEIVDAVENHQFPPLTALMWRNTQLRFTSIEALLASLDRSPPTVGLVRSREADDHLALAALTKDDDIRRLAGGYDRLKLLWEVCQIPDFRKVMADAHTRLLAQIFQHLTGPGEVLPTDWLAGHIERLDRVDGEIDTLVQRIANVRTWTYVSHRADWVGDAGHWQAVTRVLEDRLSDALHERLTQRFVDRRTAVLMRRMRDAEDLVGSVARGGAVQVEGQHIGRLVGFRFEPDASEGINAARAVLGAAARALKPEIATRVDRLLADADSAFAFGEGDTVLWQGELVARLSPGADILRPNIDPVVSDLLEPVLRDKLRRRLGEWLVATVAEGLRPLMLARQAKLTGPARGLVHQLAEALGSLPRLAAAAQVSALGDSDRQQLTRLGVRFGLESVFMPVLLKPAAQALRARLWCTHTSHPGAPLPGGKAAIPADAAAGLGFYDAVGYRVVGPMAVRVDILERITAELRQLARKAGAEGFSPTPLLHSLLARPLADVVAVVSALGYRRHDDGHFRPLPRSAPRRRPQREVVDSDHPFAVLKRRGI